MPFFLALGAAAFMSTVVMRMTDPVVGPLSHDFAVEPTRIALFATAFALPYALFQLVFGPLGDRFGKTRVIRLAVLALAAMIAASALAPDYPTMLTLRFLSGMFGGAVIPLGLATIGDRFALPDRQVMLSRFMVATFSGQIAGSFVTGILAEVMPWRLIYAGYALLALGIGLGLFTIRAGGDASSEPLTLGGTLRRYAGILTGDKARALLPIVFVEGGLFFGFLAFAPAYLSEMRHLSPGDIGFVIASYAVGGMALTLVVKPILRLFGSYGMIAAGGLIGGLAVEAMALPLPVAGHMAASAGVGFAFTLIHNNLQTRATEMAPEARGSSVAVFACCLFFGNGTGPILMKSAVDLGGYVAAFRGLGLIMVLFGIVAALSLRHREQRLPQY